jgi:hypothetical protein
MMPTSSKVMLDSTTDSRRYSHPNSSTLVVKVMNKMVFGIPVSMNADNIQSGAIAYARLSVSKKSSFIPSYYPILLLSYATEYQIK